MSTLPFRPAHTHDALRMTQTIRARDAADFLTLIPQLAGYTPRQSLVIVPFTGSRSAGLLRFDLPAAEVEAFASTAIGLVCRLQEVDGLAVVVYSSMPWDGGRAHEALVRALASRADACGLRWTDALGVSADGWGRFLQDPSHPARSLTEIAQTLSPVTGDQAAQVRVDPADPLARAAVAAALADVEDALLAVCGDAHGSRGGIDGVDPRALDAIAALDDSGRLWEEALHSVRDGQLPLPSYRAALLLWTLSRPGLRDVALAQWCHGVGAGAQALDDQLRWESGDPYPDGPLFLAGEGPRPQPGRLEDARTLCVALASVGEGRHRAAAFAVAAWLSWAIGAGTHADLYAQAALGIDPALSLAQIVRDLACRGHLPAWAFDGQEAS